MSNLSIRVVYIVVYLPSLMVRLDKIILLREREILVSIIQALIECYFFHSNIKKQSSLVRSERSGLEKYLDTYLSWSVSYQLSLNQPGRNQTYPSCWVIPILYAWHITWRAKQLQDKIKTSDLLIWIEDYTLYPPLGRFFLYISRFNVILGYDPWWYSGEVNCIP